MQICEILQMTETLNDAIKINSVDPLLECSVAQDGEHYIIITKRKPWIGADMEPVQVIKGTADKMQSLLDNFGKKYPNDTFSSNYYIALFDCSYHLKGYSSFSDIALIGFFLECLVQIGQSQNLNLPECPIVEL
jgi:hypothetical protein